MDQESEMDKYWEAAKELVGKPLHTKKDGAPFTIIEVGKNLRYRRSSGKEAPYSREKVVQCCYDQQNGKKFTLANIDEYSYLPTIVDEILKIISLKGNNAGHQIWKLGCNWGRGKNSFYTFIKEKKIAIGVEDKEYNVDDLVIITEGFQVNAIARIKEKPKPVTSNIEFKEAFKKYEIPYKETVNFAPVEWLDLDNEDRFKYKTQKGIIRVHVSEINQKVINLWESRNINYWIFQGNPKEFNFIDAMRSKSIDNWTVSTHKDKIKVGDKVILWISGKDAGCYALAKITSDPADVSTSKDSSYWIKEDKNPYKAGIKITFDALNHPLLWDEVEKIKGLKSLKVGVQGTNFSATKDEYNIIWKQLDENHIPIEIRIIYAYLVDSISHRKIQEKILKKKAPPNGGGFEAMDVLHKYEIEGDKKGIVKKNGLESEITNAQGKYLEALYLLKKYYPELINDDLTKGNYMAKNIILYGPPGTGKTYHSIDKAIEIAMNKQAGGDHQGNKKEFDRLREEGQIEFITFHQNYSYEDFVFGIKPDLDNSNLKFKENKGVFYKISEAARVNFEEAKNLVTPLKPFKEVFFDHYLKLLQDGLVSEIEVKMATPGNSFWITEINDVNLSFRKMSGGTSHTLSFDTIEELYTGGRVYSGGLKCYYNPLVEQLWLIGKSGVNKSVQEKRYVLVIDEINRANISKVFGELITLLEDDKRIGEENSLKVRLPNGKDFGVPPNLYIIGTMNTADKSIALIDIALRRRFEFIGKYPMYDSLSPKESTLLKKINGSIYEKKKSADFLIGHAYFMKNEQIKDVLDRKVIPLLMEYFSNKTDIVEEIFKNTGWTVKYNTDSYTWNIKEE